MVQALTEISWFSDWLLGLDETITMLLLFELMLEELPDAEPPLRVSCHSIVYCQVIPIWLGCNRKNKIRDMNFVGLDMLS